MNQTDAKKQISEVNNRADMGVAAIYFTDGERHLAPVWSIESTTTHLSYRDVHMDAHQHPIRVEYKYIARIVDNLRETREAAQQTNPA